MLAVSAAKDAQACLKAVKAVLKAAEPKGCSLWQPRQLNKLANAVKGLVVPWRRWCHTSAEDNTLQEQQAMADALTVFLRSAVVTPAWQGWTWPVCASTTTAHRYHSKRRAFVALRLPDVHNVHCTEAGSPLWQSLEDNSAVLCIKDTLL